MAASDPWDVFGSDSDEDSSATAVTQQVPPVALTGVRPLAAKKTQRRYAWETLLPSFRFPAGFDENGVGEVAGIGGSPAEDPVPEAPAAAMAPFSDPPVYQHPSVRYEACLPHRGGGRGFVASADIAPGTLLLAEKRFLPMPTAEECALAGGIGPEELCLRWILDLPPDRLKEVLGQLRWLHPQSLEDLPEDEADELMSRHEDAAKGMLTKLKERHSVAGEAKGKEPVGLDLKGVVRLFGALQSNGFASGIYLHPAMTNHSCRPNAIKWRAGQSISTGQMSEKKPGDGAGADAGEKGGMVSEIRATEFIPEGEEITISYLEPREIALASRQSRLKDQFGFDCDCVLCEGTCNDTTGITANNRSTCATHGDKTAITSGFAAPLEAFLQLQEDEHQGAEDVPSSRVEGSGRRGMSPVQENQRERTAEDSAVGQDSSGSMNLATGTTRKEGSGGGLQDEGGDELADRDEENREGMVVRNVLERRLEAAESVVDLSRATEVRWTGVLSEVLGYRMQASRWLSPRHISLARADKLIAKACIAILQGSTEAAQSDAECVESVRQASDGLPWSFGGESGLPSSINGAFKIRLLAVFLAALISRRKTQLLYLGDSPHPETGACLADLSQAMGMLLAQGSDGQKWIERLPGPDRQNNNFNDGNSNNSAASDRDEQALTCDEADLKASVEAVGGAREGSWWCLGGVSGASMFERECDKAAKRVGRLFDAPQLKKAGMNAGHRR